MKAEDIKQLYNVSPKIHESIEHTLQQLNDTSKESYRKRIRVRRLIVAFAVVAFLVSFTTVAYASHLFGLLTEDVGEYGVDMHIAQETTSLSTTAKRYAKPNPTYLPEGCRQLIDDEGNANPEGITSYNPNGNYTYTDSDNVWVHFHVYEADGFHEEARYIVDRMEKEYNGHKVVFLTRQHEDNGEKDYYAIEYFEDWGYVVDCYYDMPELMKIMEGLELQEADDYVEQPTLDLGDDPTADYAFSLEYETTERRMGETFTWSWQTVNASTYDNKDGEYEITVKSVTEHDGVKGLDKNGLLAPNDEEWYARFFNGDGSLKTPYIRTDYNSGDGIDSLGHIETQEVNRRFYLVTIEVKTIDGRYGGFNGQFMADGGGVIYRDEVFEDGAEILTVGVVADEDGWDDLALNLYSEEIIIDDENKTVVRKEIETVIPLLVKSDR